MVVPCGDAVEELYWDCNWVSLDCDFGYYVLLAVYAVERVVRRGMDVCGVWGSDVCWGFVYNFCG